MPVTGIGGFFFRSDDPAPLSAWYQTHLGITAGYSGWKQSAGTTIFAPFPKASDYFPADKSFMLNLRVDDIDALIASLTAAGIAVTTNPEWDTPETGRFARLYDPEGNAIELWQPPED
ncbi:VOC family protein [Asticcacaulis sp. 201]|uniref:VOC family protein n=1 Tax=Asticcacaulis sp. 201 TaxID=3028787 RepID=UPI002915F948|nr:VOC family protein [Asticcacaulis sp. 201]MDV6330006.1 VOC family protein [Asticcacaulis sp. 201]